MVNVDLKITDKKKLVITIDLKEDGSPSSSGKNMVVATTSGNQEIIGFPGMKLGLTLYKPIAN